MCPLGNLLSNTTGGVWIWGDVLQVEYISCVITNHDQHQWVIPSLFSICLCTLVGETLPKITTRVLFFNIVLFRDAFFIGRYLRWQAVSRWITHKRILFARSAVQITHGVTLLAWGSTRVNNVHTYNWVKRAESGITISDINKGWNYSSMP